ncbi:inorganic diphosphatase [Adhaeribacter soli]|uniref:inorganic diphosphatase n=1 Tax=Adhaeribacter soli TaxID=2607655 RepID=A0A5N1IUT3_9BACT|nr:inorganic diphosphatase [Adhaeribacter soli]KAA9333527.1 inorganic diphosphatase [Adhaeribacter soli]
MKKVIFLLLLPWLTGCSTDYPNLPAFSQTRQLQAVIETPAGSAHKYYYNAGTGEFTRLQEAGQDKMIRFLPYPGNAGFIPSTRIDSDGDPLEVLVIAESQPTGTVTEIMPLGMLLLERGGELYYQLIATPARPGERLLEATNYQEFSTKNAAVKKILETWFLQSDPASGTKIMGWKDENFAENIVQQKLK